MHVHATELWITIALFVVVTGIGIEATLAVIGVPGRWPLIIAFAVLAAFTYRSGLRAPALIAFVKDALVYLLIIVAIIYIPAKIGGWEHIFTVTTAHFKAVPPHTGNLLTSDNQLTYATLAFGSAAAIFLYPHAITGVLSTRSRDVVKRSIAWLPVYSIVLGLIALLGLVALAAKINAIWGRNIAGQPGQIAYSIWDAKVNHLFLPPMYPPVVAEDVGAVAAGLGLDAGTVAKTVAAYNKAVVAGAFDPSRLDGCRTSGLEPPKSNWAQPIDTPPFYGVAMRPGITFTFMGVKVTEEGRVRREDGGVFRNVSAAGEIMSGNILSSGYLGGFGLTIGTVWGRIAGAGAAAKAAGTTAAEAAGGAAAVGGIPTMSTCRGCPGPRAAAAPWRRPRWPRSPSSRRSRAPSAGLAARTGPGPRTG